MGRPAWLLTAALMVVGLVALCRRPAPEEPWRWSPSGMLAEAARYLDDPAFRRSELERSLVNPNNSYSRLRLENYGMGNRAWDLLPEWNPKSRELDDEQMKAIASGKSVDLTVTAPLWDGVRPTTMDAWIALGREVFFRYPLRSEVFVEYAAKHPDEAARLGVLRTTGGRRPGFITFVDTDGRTNLGISCALCHSNVVDGELALGEARRSFDFGGLRLAHQAATGSPIEPGLARRMRSWGPGRADVTEDDDEDPVAIPDLWGLRSQGHLTQAGTIRQDGPVALALRQETQLLTSNHQRVRPPRALAFALAAFVYSLTPPAKSRDPSSEEASAKGKKLFQTHCARCHGNGALGGDLVAQGSVETDGALAHGAARGTGRYRPPSLLRVDRAAPYFHHGAVRTLEDVLDPARLEAGFTGGALRPGPVPGHTYGTELPKPARDELVAYMKSL